jgi:hypothetical protein
MVNAFSFSYTPKPSTALASITPLKLLGEGREALRFTASTPMSFIKQNPEIVTEGFWKGRQALTEGIVKGVTSALSGVSGALTSKAQEAKATADSKLEHDRAMEIAKIKAAPTAAETAYQQQRSDLLKQQIDAAKTKNEADVADDGFDARPTGTTDWGSYNRKNFKTPVSEIPAATAPTTTPSSAPPAPVAPTTPPVAPAPAGVSQRSIFGQSKNPNFVSVRDAIKNRSVAAAPTESNLFSDISAITPPPVAESQFDYTLPVAETSTPRNLPEDRGPLVLAGATLPTVPVSGAEDKPLAGTPPPVEPALPEAVPNEPTQQELNQTVPESEADYRFRVESDLTGQAFMNPAEARMAKMILERELGVTAKVNGIDAGKGKRIYRVEIVEDAPSPMERVPKGMVMKQVTDKDGVTTNVYVPAMPVEQQVQYVNVALDRAKTLKTAIKEIRGIIGGISPGVGGAANLMAKLPFQTDASTVESLNETIKGIIGFQELVDLKAAGGSLGALSDAELKMLTSLQGSLDVKNLHRDKYLKVLENIETRATDVEKKMEANKKDLMRVENKTNFQPIQTPKSEPPKKGDEFYNSKTKQTLVWDGNSYISK